MASTSDNSVIYQNNWLASYFATFQEMKRSGEYCDVTFRVGSQLLTAHRNIVAAAFPHFRRIFRSERRNETEVEVEEMDPDTLKTFVKYAYGEKIVIDDENVQSLLLGAEFLQVEEIRKVCCHFLEEKLCPDNVFRIRTFGERSNRSGLVESCDRYIRENFDECSQREEFSDLPLSALKQLINRDDLRVENEEKVFEAIMRWVKKSPSTRQVTLPELLMDVRLTLLTPGYLIQQVANEELVRNSLICKDLLEEAKTYHLLPEEQLSSLRTLPRCYNHCQHTFEDGREGIYVVSPQHRYPVLEFYDFEKRMWNNVSFRSQNQDYQSFPNILKLSNLLEVGNKIYVFRDLYLDELDLETRTWRIIKSLDHMPYDVAVKHCNDTYFCGGNVGKQWCIAQFDPTSYSFTVVALASPNIEDPGITSLDDSIYVLGGTVRFESNSYSTNDTTVYNTKRNTWTRLPPMLTKRSGPGSAVLKDKVYVCGGYHVLDVGDIRQFVCDAEVYCTSTGKWTCIAQMFSTGKMLSSVFYRGNLHVFQIFNGLLTVDIYDPETAKFECHVVLSKSTECNNKAKAIAVFRTQGKGSYMD